MTNYERIGELFFDNGENGYFAVLSLPQVREILLWAEQADAVDEDLHSTLASWLSEAEWKAAQPPTTA